MGVRCFADCRTFLFGREESWIDWKRENCISFEKPKADPPKQKPEIKMRGKLGHKSLDKIWNTSITIEDSDPIKTIEGTLNPALEEFAEDSGIEPEYQMVNNEIFQWKAYRTIARNKYNLIEVLHKKNLRETIRVDWGGQSPAPPAASATRSGGTPQKRKREEVNRDVIDVDRSKAEGEKSPPEKKPKVVKKTISTNGGK